ncbi:CAAX protease family protein [Marchantia polymorpha subsp. ruderalis]|uniref:CAAX prenyl protease 2/Lysostaphin resistance protein A-like domain-containing protein n=2 Tax=Marchantia polymorpha TaxID=3197 RepID=A0A176VY76_MARPO|nr:hypothetical protein AXG93_4368s1770 [Marchantia polymorpha subsp. ruderalis]PTQ41689.1 hypothetical protein MARPO_0033s0092 [Marchantia polymorpha]BBM98717.1 hypothetical protein Mp_1g15690 [Marchantia polymorpha subsp. ruderalis]|eukprot:PTQ41689.1 hypothetical protein MARPO_0033s0092 [Marchantia polymorpha]
MIRAGQACSMSMSQSFGLGLSLSLPRANHLLRVPAARCRARTLARTACSERTSLAGGSFRCLPSLSKNESAIGASDFLLCLHGRSDGCSSFSPRDAGAERILCRAKNDLFSNREPEDDEAIIQKTGWPVLERWDIPWDGKTTSLGMVAWLLSFLLTGLVVSVVAAQFGIGRRQYMSLDDQAVYILIHQLAQTIAGLSIINFAVNKYKPLPDGLFRFELNSPFNLERGWLLWGGLGLLCSGAAVVAASYVSAAINGQPPSRDDTDALVQLLPIIGASPLSTASLIGVTGVLAPLLEETVFRGFLMTSLTKWVPTPVAVIISAIAFAGAHLTPGEFPQLFALGIILGFSYAQTRNLACPMLIHCIWNSGVVVVLTLLRLQGYDIKELL